MFLWIVFFSSAIPITIISERCKDKDGFIAGAAMVGSALVLTFITIPSLALAMVTSLQ